MEIFLIRALQFMMSISLLVLIHEGGHFLFAKLFGIRVEKFYLFFDPWFHIFEFKPKKSDTAYGMGWLPLGGYCKISGMIDESFDTEQMKQPAQPWEFRSHPAWQRLFVMIGGVLFNFLLALFIYSMILFTWGDSYIPVKNMTHGMKFNQEAKALGFRDGDILVGTEKGEFKDFSADLFREISEAKRVDIIRAGKPMSITLSGELNLLSMIKNQPPFVRPLLPCVADTVMGGTPAAKIGMRKGDRIIALNGKPVDSYNTFTDEIAKLGDVLATVNTAADSMKVRKATVVLEHQDKSRDTANVVLTADLKLGFATNSYAMIYKPYTKEYGFFESFPADWDWYMFWRMTALLSVMLAFMNILPIPALDGGHVLFLIYEMITRRKPSEDFMVKAEYVGFAIIILLMVVANLNDVLRWLGYM